MLFSFPSLPLPETFHQSFLHRLVESEWSFELKLSFPSFLQHRETFNRSVLPALASVCVLPMFHVCVCGPTVLPDGFLLPDGCFEVSDCVLSPLLAGPGGGRGAGRSVKHLWTR